MITIYFIICAVFLHGNFIFCRPYCHRYVAIQTILPVLYLVLEDDNVERYLPRL